MKTPIVDFVNRYRSADVSRLHMPGHKGIPFLGCEPLDITEICGADVLYSPDGIIEESEQNASTLFDTAHSFYSAEGSSLSIKAMLALIAKTREDGQKPLILAARNVHKAFVYACALLDLEVAWLMSKDSSHLCSCHVTGEDVKRALQTLPRRPSAVYLTSPDYLGQRLDVREIANICHQNQIPLLVDNAHGAYLHFLPTSEHPIALGADLCADSAHKTLPVLTGGAYLHVSRNADPRFCKDARRMLSLFASTSPSYLILQSLDLCNRYLAEGYRDRLSACVERLNLCRQRLAEHGIETLEGEPLKLVLDAGRIGYTGEELADYLRAQRIEAEFADRDFLVLMFTPETRKTDFERVEGAFSALPHRARRATEGQTIIKKQPESVMSIREAIFAPHETVATGDAVGRICAAPTVSCPPAVPVAVSGERIDHETATALQYYGIETVEVVKNR